MSDRTAAPDEWAWLPLDDEDDEAEEAADPELIPCEDWDEYYPIEEEEQDEG